MHSLRSKFFPDNFKKQTMARGTRWPVLRKARPGPRQVPAAMGAQDTVHCLVHCFLRNIIPVEWNIQAT